MANATKQIPSNVADALRAAEYKEEGIFLGAPGTMEAKLYKQVTKVLEGLGIKWDRRKGFHAPNDPHKTAKQIVEEALDDGSYRDEKTAYRQEFQFFPTVPEVARRMAIHLFSGSNPSGPRTLLEPSAGRGALVKAVRDHGFIGDIVAVEVQGAFCEELLESANRVLNADFLGKGLMEELGDQEFDYIIANPPFSEKRDYNHINHAINFLKVGGKMVCLVSSGCRTDWPGVSVEVIDNKVVAGTETKAVSKMLLIVRDC